MEEEIEVHVQSTGSHNTQASQPVSDVLHKLLLAGIGVMAQTRDDTEAFINRMAERGEQAQKNGEQVLHKATLQLQPKSPKEQMERIEAQVETQVEQFLNRFNIPSKRDIDDLSAKIAQLASRVEELQRNR